MNNATESHSTIRMRRPTTSVLPPVQKNSDDPLKYWGLRSQCLAKDWRRRLDSMVVRKKSTKSTLDSCLKDTIPQPPKHLGMAWEGREGRVILALDMKHAYPFAVAHCKWADPNTLEYVTSDHASPTNPDIVGVYYVRLNKQRAACVPPISIRAAGGRVISVKIETPCELWVHSCEWAWWNDSFELDVLYGLQGKSLAHPLHTVANALYKKYETQKDPRVKTMMRMLHTAMGSRKDKEEQREDCLLWSLMLAPLYFVRAHWLCKWREIQARYPTAVLCYANIDSMHWSINEDEWNASPYMSDKEIEWGDWRIAYTAKKGLWLSIGKYWLLSDKNIVAYPTYMTRPWATKKRVSSKKGQVNLYLWNGLIHATKMFRKETQLIQYTIPTIQQAHDITTMQRWFIQNARCDRQWKKKLWFNLKRGYDEKT